MDLIEEELKKRSGKIVKSFPMLSMFLSDDMVEKVNEIIQGRAQGLHGSRPMVAKKIEKDLDEGEMVRESEAFFDKLKQFLPHEKFRFIEVIGAFIGFLIGWRWP